MDEKRKPRTLAERTLAERMMEESAVVFYDEDGSVSTDVNQGKLVEKDENTDTIEEV